MSPMRSVAGMLILAVGAVVVAAAAPSRTGTGWTWELPPGFPEPVVPADNPMSVSKVELGRHLFYDTRLSGNGTQSCATCHQQERAFSEPLATSVGSTGESHPRGSMSLANVVYAPSLTWANPGMRSLEAQALVPMFGDDPIELGLQGHDVALLEAVRVDERYRLLFPEAQDPFTLENLVKAIGAFERTMISGDSPYDRAQHGDTLAMSAEARRGEEVFFSETTECFHCHGGVTFTGPTDFVGKGFVELEFHNTGLYNLDAGGRYPGRNTGVFEHTLDPADMGRFKAPTLRNIALTAPYMHDGSIETLDAVVAHYAAGGRTIADGPHAGVGSGNPNKSEFINGFVLSAEDRTALIAFLESLTDSTFINDPRFADPWQAPLRFPSSIRSSTR